MPRLFLSLPTGRNCLMLACVAALCLGRQDSVSAADIAPERIAELEVQFMGRGYDITGRYAHESSFRHPVYRIEGGWSKDSRVPEFGSVAKSGKSFKEFYNKLNLAASVQGEYGVYSGEFDVQFSSKHKTSQRSAFMNYTQHMDYVLLELGRHYWKSDTVYSEIMRDEANGGLKPDQVIEKYGTHFTKKIVLGGRVTVSSTLEESAAESETNLNTHIRAAYSGVVSGEASAGNDSNSASDVVNRTAIIEVYGGAPALAGKVKARQHGATGFDEWAATVPANPVISRIPERDGLYPIWALCNSPDTVHRKAALRKATEEYIARKGVKLEGGTGESIPDGAKIIFQLAADTSKYIGGNRGTYYGTLGPTANAYHFGFTGDKYLQSGKYGVIYLPGQPDLHLYETGAGNAGLVAADPGDTARWMLEKVTANSSSGTAIRDGDRVIIRNKYYPSTFIYDYGGTLKAGNYPSHNHQWIVTVQK